MCCAHVCGSESLPRFTLDIGAASLARMISVQQLRKFASTKDAVGESEPIRPIRCEGVVKGMLTKPMTQITPTRLTVKDVEQNLLRPPKHGSRQETRVVEFVELEGAADAILIGFPDSVDWGFALESHEDGNVYAHFASLGVSILVERGCSTGEARRVMEDMVVEGPAVRSLTAYWAGDPKGQWVLDSGWPGVRVVEKFLLEG